MFHSPEVYLGQKLENNNNDCNGQYPFFLLDK